MECLISATMRFGCSSAILYSSINVLDRYLEKIGMVHMNPSKLLPAALLHISSALEGSPLSLKELSNFSNYDIDIILDLEQRIRSMVEIKVRATVKIPINIREDVKYYLADFVRKGGGGYPPNP